MYEHEAEADEAFVGAHLGEPPRTLAMALRYITRLLWLLPAHEAAGYVAGPPGGENVWPLEDGTLVRISRVMYPNGDIIKVLSDAPNGTPQWVPEDNRPELYVPYRGEHATPGVPVPPPADGDLQGTVDALVRSQIQILTLLADARTRIEAVNDAMVQRTNDILDGQIGPDYEGVARGSARIFGVSLPVTITVVSKPVRKDEA